MHEVIGTDILIRTFFAKKNNGKVQKMSLSQCRRGGFENYWEYKILSKVTGKAKI